MMGLLREGAGDNAELLWVEPASPSEVLDKLTELVRQGELPAAVFLEAARQLEGAEIMDARRDSDGFVKLAGSVAMDERGPGPYLVVPIETLFSVGESKFEGRNVGIDGEET